MKKFLHSKVSSFLKVLTTSLVMITPPGLVASDKTTLPPGVDTMVVPWVKSSEQAPVIDGMVKGKEWDYALSLSGLISIETPHLLTQRQATIKLITDGEYLYLGVYSPAVPEGTAPEMFPNGPQHKKTYDGFIGVDRIEAKFSPPDSQTAGYVYFVGDAGGTILDQRATNEFSAMGGDWEVRNFYDEKGWTAELRVKLNQLSQKPPEDGDKWGINVSIARLFPMQYAGFAKGPHVSRDAFLVKGAPAFQIQSLGDLPKGFLDLKATLREYEGLVSTPKETAYDDRKLESGGMKLAATGAVATVFCELLDKSGTVVFSKEEKINLLPGVAVPVHIKHSFQPEQLNSLRLRVVSAPSSEALAKGSDEEGKRTLYEANLPFKPYDKSEEALWAQRLTKGSKIGSWKFNPVFFPYWEKAKVAATFMAGELRDQARRLRVSVVSDKGFKAGAEVEIKNGSLVTGDPRNLAEIPIPGMPEATYTVTGEVLDENGKVLDQAVRTYQRIKFPWEGNQLGLSRKVIKPWTPMEVDGSGVSMWGRTYQLEQSGLPQQIISQEKPILADPISVRLWSGPDSAEAMLVPEGPIKFDEKAEDRVRWAGTGKIGDTVKVSVNGLAEYDGFTWYEVTLDAAKATTLTKGRIEIALPDEVAQLMHFQSTWARDNFSGAVPKGTGTIFRSLDTVNYGFTGGFSPHVWIGNLHRGLSWFADSDEGWASSAGISALEIERIDGQVVLVMNIITRPIQLTKPRTIRFGLMASPVRPLTPLPNIRTRAVNWLDADNKKVFQAHMYAPYPKDFDYALADRELKRLQGSEYDGVRLYFNKHEIGAAMKERAVFDNEWGGMEPAPDYPGAPERFGPGIESRTVNRALTDSRIDMLVYYISEMAKKTSMAGTYWDITGISVGHPMIENGTAYLDEETGTIKQTFDVLKSRDLFKRVATMWEEVRGEMDPMEMHSTNHIGVPFYSFSPIWLNFEWLWPNEHALREDGSWMDFIDLRPLDTFAVEGVPEQFGSWIHSINSGTRPADLKEIRRIERSGIALGSLHNHKTGWNPTIGKREDLVFVGYWNDKKQITSSDPLIRASFWQNEDSLEVVVVNLGLKQASAQINLVPTGGSWDKAVIEEIPTTQEAEIIISNGKNYAKLKNPAAELQAIEEDLRKAARPVKFSAKASSLALDVELPSHDYRVFRIIRKP